MSGVEDGDWYEEQFQFLLERMLAHHRRIAEQMQRLPALKTATRREILRRIGLAVDLVHSSYEQDIGLAEMAQAACLSKFHFLRLFTELHGITPHAYLQRKRAMAAARLLETSSLSAGQVAERVGFNSRSTMARQMRRWSLDYKKRRPEGRRESIRSRRNPGSRLEVHRRPHEDEATEGVVGLRVGVAIAGRTHRAAERRVVVEHVVDAERQRSPSP